MSDDLEKIREELAEVRKMKEQLKDEIEEVRRNEKERIKELKQVQKEKVRRARAARKEARRRERVARKTHAPRPPKGVPRPPKPPRVTLDLAPLTESLEDMWYTVGTELEKSLEGLEMIAGDKRLSLRPFRMRHSGKKRTDREIEQIPPNRVAVKISPLSNEERLSILDFLKEGGKSFKELEEATGKQGSSLTHHLNPLIDAGYVLKGQVRGTYYVTVEGRLAYRLAQWLTHRLEALSQENGKNSVAVHFDEDELDDHIDEVADETAGMIDEYADEVDEHVDMMDEKMEEMEGLEEELLDRLDEEEEHLEELEAEEDDW